MKFQFQKQYFYYLLDWFLCGLFIIIAKIFDIFYSPNLQQVFNINDNNIKYPMTQQETVSNLWLWLTSLLFPLIIIITTRLIKKDWNYIHLGCLGLFLSISVNYLITHVIKNLASRLRPDFLSRCDPNLELIKEQTLLTLYTISICQQSNLKLLRAGMQSFYSGHTSTSFSGLFYLSIYLYKLLFNNNQQQTYNKVYKLYPCLLPILTASFIMISRVTDYRHHFTDVLFGMIMGIICSVFSYQFYFPWYSNPLVYYNTNNSLSNSDPSLFQNELVPLPN
ncbi:acid phosphatase/Vanadium-dependent haloperoxidase [Neoconidiobolus thromboides FSU 785]|nr:acid phosphatase/Vanadium-dependent haloperoxidase [Neoconidiobolus thromboides FSU 785]